jgi:hypothetical protein
MRFPLAAAASVLLFASSLATAQAPRNAPGRSENPPAPAARTTSSNVVCYFGLDGQIWAWGLKPNNDYFWMDGEWITTKITKTEKFKTDVSQDSIVAACNQAKEYYKITEDLFATCAGVSGIGKSYALVSNNVQMYPFRC